MPATERDSLQLKLREVLGEPHAATLMSLLPPDQSQLATKGDINDLSVRVDGLDVRMGRLEERMGRLEGLMVKFDERLWDFHEALRAQTRVYITAMVSTRVGVGALAFAAAALM
jgi:predicted nuclease with TOPRIM domain